MRAKKALSLSSFRKKQESAAFSLLWIPAQKGLTGPDIFLQNCKFPKGKKWK